MTAEERIRILRLLQKLEKRPVCARVLGIEAYVQGNPQKNPK